LTSGANKNEEIVKCELFIKLVKYFMNIILFCEKSFSVIN